MITHTFTLSEFCTWPSFKEWDQNYFIFRYETFLTEQHPDCIITADAIPCKNVRDVWTIAITFKSEEHYHWFLLQQ